MAYKLEYLPSANIDLLEAELYLYEHSPAAADKFIEKISELEAPLVEHPFMYPVYQHDKRFRLMPLAYGYLCFYHIDEMSEVVTIHRVFRGMRDIPNLL